MIKHSLMRSSARPVVMILLGSLTITGCENPVARATPALAKSAPLTVDVAKPLVRLLRGYDIFTGRTEATDTVEIRARVSGYLVKVAFEDGQMVQKDQLLYEIDPRPYEAAHAQAEGQVAMFVARLRKDNVDLARIQRLRVQNVASQDDLDKAITAKAETEAALFAAKAKIQQAQLDLNFTKITAPFEGRISRTLITEGNLVNASAGEATLLSTLVSVDPMYVYFDVNERIMLEYQMRRRESGGGTRPATWKEADIAVEAGLSNETGFPHRGYLDFADNRVDPTTGTIRARGNFDNADRALTPGLFTRVRVWQGSSYKALLIPDRAINTDQGLKYVYIVDEKNRVKRRNVELGELRDGYRVIAKGIGPDDPVVVTGAQRLREDAEVKTQPSQPEDLPPDLEVEQTKISTTPQSDPPPAQAPPSETEPASK